MHVDCLHCGQTLEYSDRRPSFCAYCGKAIDRPKLGSTTSAAEPPTVPPEPGTGHAEPAPEVVDGYRRNGASVNGWPTAACLGGRSGAW
jgi:hypothetical protein